MLAFERPFRGQSGRSQFEISRPTGGRRPAETQEHRPPETGHWWPALHQRDPCISIRDELGVQDFPYELGQPHELNCTSILACGTARRRRNERCAHLAKLVAVFRKVLQRDNQLSGLGAKEFESMMAVERLCGIVLGVEERIFG